jgi:hypothetical protein
MPALVGRIPFVPYHEVESRVGVRIMDLADLATPFAVVGTAALLLWLMRPGPRVLALAVAAGVLYTNGHGIHLAANSVAGQPLEQSVERTIYFWDERLGHIEWHLGWIGLLASFVLAASDTAPFRPVVGLATISMLGFALAGASLEGQTWWMVLAAAPLFVWRAAAHRTHTSLVVGAAVLLAAAGILSWAAYWGGVPQLTEVVQL